MKIIVNEVTAYMSAFQLTFAEDRVSTGCWLTVTEASLALLRPGQVLQASYILWNRDSNIQVVVNRSLEARVSIKKQLPNSLQI